MSESVNFGRSLTDVRQPAIDNERFASAQGHLARYRVMAFVTGVVLAAGTVALILKYAFNVHLPGYAIVWVAHGWLYVIYLVATVVLGFRLRWPLPRYVLVMLAGTIPTMSFVAEH
uniref:DUF3817 domain-containing protein n=1 Tax=uncultured Jatrophihabitans sp. TaxID=1610747 RepID=UPI0035C9DE3D